VPESSVILERKGDIAYFGQGYELSISFPLTEIDENALRIIKQKFNKAHEDAFGYCLPEAEISIVNIGVTSIGKMPRPELIERVSEKGDGTQAFKSKRTVFLDGDYREVNIIDRYKLKSGDAFEGPCIVEQDDTTTLIWQGQLCEVDKYGNLIIYTKSGRGGKK
jgi:N-methylhydantoinase A/oxoprolinase/acetone carboxylase beta subunit